MNRDHLDLLARSKYHQPIMVKASSGTDSRRMIEVCERCRQMFPCDTVAIWRAYQEEGNKNRMLATALAFYADPETYFGIGFFPDVPCGRFLEDFSDVQMHYGASEKPGKMAREALEGM